MKLQWDEESVKSKNVQSMQLKVYIDYLHFKCGEDKKLVKVDAMKLLGLKRPCPSKELVQSMWEHMNVQTEQTVEVASIVNLNGFSSSNKRI